MFRRLLRSATCASLLLCGTACKRASEPAIAPVTASTPLPAAEAVVTASRGKVELLHGPSGSWAPAKVGDRLTVRDSLRTDLGEADLAVEGVRVRLHESSRLELKQVDRRALRAKIGGSLESEVDQTGRLDVEMEGSSATAFSQGGHFFVTADGRGVVAVAAVTGSVHLNNGGRTVDVSKGEVSKVVKGEEAPSVPAAALRRVLLSVEWPRIQETNQAVLPLSGRVEPGSRVFVQGEPVTVESAGTFRAEVPLRQGRQ
ncbi:MAG TPA: hypothetical protein VF993_02650, partial [Myxococcales bacterium]